MSDPTRRTFLAAGAAATCGAAVAQEPPAPSAPVRPFLTPADEFRYLNSDEQAAEDAKEAAKAAKAAARY